MESPAKSAAPVSDPKTNVQFKSCCSFSDKKHVTLVLAWFWLWAFVGIIAAIQVNTVAKMETTMTGAVSSSTSSSTSSTSSSGDIRATCLYLATLPSGSASLNNIWCKTSSGTSIFGTASQMVLYGSTADALDLETKHTSFYPLAIVALVFHLFHGIVRAAKASGKIVPDFYWVNYISNLLACFSFIFAMSAAARGTDFATSLGTIYDKLVSSSTGITSVVSVGGSVGWLWAVFCEAVVILVLDIRITLLEVKERATQGNDPGCLNCFVPHTDDVKEPDVVDDGAVVVSIPSNDGGQAAQKQVEQKPAPQAEPKEPEGSKAAESLES